MGLLEPAAPAPRVGGGRDRRRSSCPPCSARRGCAVRCGRSPPRSSRSPRVALAPARRRRRRRVPAARPLGRAVRRRGARARGAARRARALPRPRRVDADGDRRPAGRCWSSSPRCSRSGRGAAAPASRRPRVLALVTLYVVPAVVLDFEGEFLRGAALALLLLAFLRLEKLRVRDAPAAGVGALGVARSLALVAAPALDGREPWWDYESWALETAGTQDGELQLGPRLQPAGLAARRPRAAARQGALPRLLEGRATSTCSTGSTWRRDPRQRGERPTPAAAATPPRATPRWSQRIEVTLRNLQHRHVHRRGHHDRRCVGEDAATRSAAASSARPAGSAAATPTRPTSTRRCRATASCAPPSTDYADWLRSYTSRVLLPQPPAATTATARCTIRGRVPVLGHGAAEPEAERFGESARRGGARARAARARARVGAGAGAAARARRRRSSTSQRVEAYLDDGFAYSERAAGRGRDARRLPVRREDRLLPAVLRRRGAAAADGRRSRRASPPASPPARSTRSSSEYVVRDLDAHSWVEVWFPELRLGHARPDAGERAAALAAGRGRAGAPNGGSARRAGPRRRAPRATSRAAARSRRTRARARSRSGSAAARRSWPLAGGAASMRRRRRLRPPPALRPMAEFERALRRARFDAAPGHDARGDGAHVRRLAGRGGLRARAARAALLRPPGGADRRAAPRAARGARARRGHAARVVGPAAAPRLSARLTRGAAAPPYPRVAMPGTATIAALRSSSIAAACRIIAIAT